MVNQSNTNTMNLSITVDDGYKRVPINNTNGDEIGVFFFNPTDIGIIQRYNKLAGTFDAITEPPEALEGEDDADGDEFTARHLEALEEAEKRLYAAVNELFGGDFAGAFFGKVNPFSPVNGSFYCEEALRAVGAFISQQFDAETAKFAERISKYTNRAQRRAAKRK